MTDSARVSTAELDRLVARDHHDPHAILGAHAAADGVVVRALHPAAESVVVLPAGVELERIHPAGLFAGELRGASLGAGGAPLMYELEVRYPDGGTWVTHDPYRFAPTLSDMDEHLFREGRHEQLWSKMGAHPQELDGVHGTSFAVWAPAARSVSVVGDFNFWDGRLHMMRALGGSGIWEIFIPAVGDGARYKFEIRAQSGELLLKADPFAFQTELPPQTASIVHASSYVWNDADYLDARAQSTPLVRPMSTYEVHLGSWRLNPLEDNRSLTYLELADELATYVADLGFTHVELLPVMAHPFTGSWGYQVTSYYAPTPRFGSPDDFRAFVDRMHERGIGVILDWVPAHFPRDAWALARFDGTALYEHEDPRRGEHPDWGTLVFNYGRNEVRNFLLANALFWAREFHCDGIRVDAVASMLYRDYSRKAGEWVPNEFGGREDLEAVAFLKELNEVLHRDEPGVISAAEESTAWPGVSRPTYLGGLGFGFKWNMGWMHDTLGYFQQDPIHRRYHHHELTFALVYAFSENFILPLSHDEVVHGKGSLINKMPGDRWQKFANLRALYAFMWAHPGKKLLVHGPGVRPGGRVEPQPLAGLAPARAGRALRRAGADPRSQRRPARHAGALRDRLRPARLLLGRAQRRRRQRRGLRARRRGRGRGRPRLRRQPLAGAAARLPARPAALGPLGRGAEHRLVVLRRHGHRQPRRGRGRCAAVARPTLLGRGHAAAAGRRVARARGAPGAVAQGGSARHHVAAGCVRSPSTRRTTR